MLESTLKTLWRLVLALGAVVSAIFWLISLGVDDGDADRTNSGSEASLLKNLSGRNVHIDSHFYFNEFYRDDYRND